MINITKKEIEMSSDLITKLRWVCGSNYKVTNDVWELLIIPISLTLNHIKLLSIMFYS